MLPILVTVSGKAIVVNAVPPKAYIPTAVTFPSMVTDVSAGQVSQI